MLAEARKKAVGRFLHCSTEVVLLPPQRRDRPIDETIALDLSDMAGPYSRSKYLAEQAAFAAAAQGQDVVVVNPTIPVGAGDRNHTPPTAMLAHYLSGSRFFLDCMLNLVDARDVAEGMILAAERGRQGERYLLGGENVSLAELLQTLERVSAVSGRGCASPRWWRSPPALPANGLPILSPGARPLPPRRASASRFARRALIATKRRASSATRRDRLKKHSPRLAAGSSTIRGRVLNPGLAEAPVM